MQVKLRQGGFLGNNTAVLSVLSWSKTLTEAVLHWHHLARPKRISENGAGKVWSSPFVVWKRPTLVCHIFLFHILLLITRPWAKHTWSDRCVMRTSQFWRVGVFLNHRTFGVSRASTHYLPAAAALCFQTVSFADSDICKRCRLQWPATVVVSPLCVPIFSLFFSTCYSRQDLGVMEIWHLPPYLKWNNA